MKSAWDVLDNNLWNILDYDLVRIKHKDGRIIEGTPITCNDGDETGTGEVDVTIMQNGKYYGIYRSDIEELELIN